MMGLQEQSGHPNSLKNPWTVSKISEKAGRMFTDRLNPLSGNQQVTTSSYSQ
jgi:hypothetical protein